jgi:mRNA interferase HigB
LQGFARAHPDAESALGAWAQTVRAASWRNPVELRRTYPHADPVVVDSGRTITVFNVRGNHYRLLTAIDYPLGVVNVLALLTHAEYAKNKWKRTL